MIKKILVTGNMGYLGPVLINTLRSNFNNLEIIGFDSGFFAHCLTDSKIHPEVYIDKQFFGVFNAVAPEPVLMKDFSKTLGRCLNRPNLVPVPSKILKLLLGDGSKLVLEGQKVLSIKLQEKKYKFKYPLLEKAIYASTKNK